ncbi:spore germination protein KA [Desulfotomaculum arcticum]|uniref:Spore germination protein KA n=2 Tax=Desulfotruncus TaxID=2867377 RepID=A0A1I2UFS9_9FIRM|nr:spore germination protein KA [Desulfotomaculum arcticum] [Desulfotruncus arcticus DSM 17038]
MDEDGKQSGKNKNKWPDKESSAGQKNSGRQGQDARDGGKSSGGGVKPNPAIEKRFADKIAENKAIDDIMNNKVKLYLGLDNNKQVLEKIFRVPENKDPVFRIISIGTKPPTRAMLLYLDGITNTQLQNTTVLQPLMLLSELRDVRADGGAADAKKIDEDFIERIKAAVLPSNQVAEAETFEQVVNDVLNGNTALIIDGFDRAILIETKGWQYRSVGKPQVEAVIRGPQEGFTELIKINTTLVRKIIYRPALVTEYVNAGAVGPMQCAVMYMADVVNPDLVKEVKRRLELIRADYLSEPGLVEQMIEDSPGVPVPQVLTTERPDRVAANLLEGKVAIFVNGNPFVMLVPCTFFNLMQSPEDAYIRWPSGSFIRIIRYLGLFMALLLPAHYVAIVAYHPEFIPTDLLLAMTGAREKVPFPSIVEVLLMETSFELIREAGIRIPGTVGTTLGIVGALILGQAAVSANIVSPILIIVVAVTALGSFAIPNYSFSLSIRLLRFVYILLGSVMGLMGILIGVYIHVGVMVTLKSFGIPFMAPAAPVTIKGTDYFMRGPVWQQETRPDYLDPLKTRRQPPKSRSWLRRGGKRGGGGK